MIYSTPFWTLKLAALLTLLISNVISCTTYKLLYLTSTGGTYATTEKILRPPPGMAHRLPPALETQQMIASRYG